MGKESEKEEKKKYIDISHNKHNIVNQVYSNM